MVQTIDPQRLPTLQSYLHLLGIANAKIPSKQMHESIEDPPERAWTPHFKGNALR